MQIAEGALDETGNNLIRLRELAVQAAKRMMRAGRTDGYVEHVERVLQQLLPMFRTKDFAEATAAFLEKRDPTFSGE